MKNKQATNRKIHLDFHTPHWVKRVGHEYDPEALVRTWKEAEVNAVTVVFGACACGNAYYEAGSGLVHPGLERDMLAPLLPVAKREGIVIYVHFSVGIHDRAVIEHPDWSIVTKEGAALDTKNGTEWGWTCLNSPFTETWFWPQFRAFVQRFPEVAGIFLDMVMIPGEGNCYCRYCKQKAEQLGLDLEREEHQERLERVTLDDFMVKTRDIVKTFGRPDLAFTCNNQWYVGGARSEALDFIELEAPVSWNSYHYPVIARYIRTLPKPSGGMTTRFPKNWGYFGSLNNPVQLKFECATIMATLGDCCVGDQLTPSGKPEEGVYELIGEAFRFVKEREAWTSGAKSVPYIALAADRQRKASSSGNASNSGRQTRAALYGAGLALLEGSRHYDIIDQDSDFSKYTCIWLAENRTFDPALAQAVRDFVESGGKLLVTGAGLWEQDDWREVLEEMANVRYDGPGRFAGTFIRPLPRMAASVAPVPYFVKGDFVRLTPGPRAETIAALHEPYEGIDPAVRFGHFHAPAGEASGEPGAVLASFGKGKIAIAAVPLAEDYFHIGSRNARQLALNMIDLLVDPEERIVEADTRSPSIEISLMSQSEPDRWVLHLVQYGAKRSTGNTVIEELPVRTAIPVSLRPPQMPRDVSLAPSGETLSWSWQDGTVKLIVPELHIHQMIVLTF